MKYFLFVSILWISLFGGAVNACPAKPVVIIRNDSALPWRSLVGKDFEKALYRATLDIKKHHLAGYLFIKKTSDTSIRILFNNDFGMQFFDFEFVNSNFIVHYCFPSMERKSLLKLLETDFRMLIFPGEELLKMAEEKSDTAGAGVYSVKNGSGKWLFEVSSTTGELLSVKSRGKIVSKTWLDLGKTDQPGGRISIENPFINLKIIMIPMDK